MSEDLSAANAGPELGAREVEQLLASKLPPIDHHNDVVEDIGDGTIRLRLPYRPEFVSPETWQDGSGLVFSGPTVMGFADTAMYACIVAAMGGDAIPVMINYGINFLRPADSTDLLADARIVRRGRRLHYLECWLTSAGAAEACAHVTSTYRVARRARNTT